jgi:predicted TIM-barrel fold metal-dependent hydrolase
MTVAAPTFPIIDADSHVTEPPDVWTARVSSKWGDLVPHVKSLESTSGMSVGDGAKSLSFGEKRNMEFWFIGDQQIATACGSAMAGWNEPFPSHPPTFAEADPACYDATARVAALDLSGIASQVLYPNVGGFGSERFRMMADPELALECVRAYNDFLIDWAAPHPGRFIPIAALPYWDVDAATKEIERAADIGHRGVIFPGAPQEWDQPYLADKHWDPLWAAAQAARLPVSFHAGSGNFTAHLNPTRIALEGIEAAFARATTAIFLDSAQQMNDLLLSGVLARFPDLQFVSVESGIGWLPFVLESADYHFHIAGVRAARPDFDLLPSEYFRRQVFACSWFEQAGMTSLLDLVGVDNVLFETDFPHPTCLAGPEVRLAADAALLHHPADVRHKVLYANAARLYGLLNAPHA